MDRFAMLPQPFARHEARRCGITDTALSRAVRGGNLVRPARGLYAVRSAWSCLEPWRRHRLLSQAAARLTPDAILSHASLAAVMGLPHPAYPPEQVTMTVLEDGRTSRSNDWRLFHRGSTPPEHVEIRGGRPRLVPARTVIDCARVLHGRDALAIADGALRSGMVTLDALLDMRWHQRRWPGITKMDEVLLLADGRRENWLESASAWSISRWGLPDPIPQVEVYSHGGAFLGRVDNLWPDLGVVGEADGLGKYLLRGATQTGVTSTLLTEQARQADLEGEGLTVVRWTTAESISGEAIHSRLAPHLYGPLRRVTARYQCGCCHGPLQECEASAILLTWRTLTRKKLERRIW